MRNWGASYNSNPSVPSLPTPAAGKCSAIRNGNAVRNRFRPGEGAERSWGSLASAFIIAFCFGLGASFPLSLCQRELTDNSTILLFGCSDCC